MHIGEEEVKGNIFYHTQVEVGKGCHGTKTIKASDIVLNQYGSLTAEMMTIPILAMQIRQKQLDNPLPKIKSFFASVLNIKTKHYFLLFECEGEFVTVDYYENSRLVIRIGDQDMVLQKNQQSKRSKSEILREKSGIQWRREFKKGRFSLGELIEYLLALKLQPYKKIAYNGGDFSKEVFNYIKDKLIKNNGSQIR